MNFCSGLATSSIGLKPSDWATAFDSSISGPKTTRAPVISGCQYFRKVGVLTHIAALITPKPSMAIEMTKEPKCDQVPTAKTRMMPICNAMIAPAISPTAI